MIIIKKAAFNEGKDFVELMLISAPYFPVLFGKSTKTILQGLFCKPANLFSFQYVRFAEYDGEKAGMILGYDWKNKKKDNLRTGFWLFRKTGIRIFSKFLRLIKFSATVGRLLSGEYYVSNIAVYPEFRGMGLGKRLIFEAEQEAKKSGAERMILDVEKDNIRAVAFYKKMGYEKIKEFSIPLMEDSILQFYRMMKEINSRER